MEESGEKTKQVKRQLVESTKQDEVKRRRKKPRWDKAKKKEAALAREQQQPKATVTKPGKKRLRKMRYQQRTLSQVQFLIVVAKNAAFTGAVHAESQELVLPNCKNLDCIFIKPLLVLDLNGILCHRVRPRNRETTLDSTRNIKSGLGAIMRVPLSVVAQTPVIPRTDLNEFLAFLDRHFCLAVWTSAKPKTADQLVKALFPKELTLRLLFVWNQAHCDHNGKKRNGGDDKAVEEPNNLKERGSPCQEEAIFEKDLSKVWKEFPLWNSSNTILMDDSPEKVHTTKGQDNGIHPPALNGFANDWVRVNNKIKRSGTILTSDDDNQQKQQSFYNGLVGFWKDHSLVQTWTGASRVATATIMRREAVQGGDSSSTCEGDAMIQYLRKHGKEAMGWN
mmetsp:Transcript_11528/g.25764  ORF Transcript_11528/g.25764 Transcript_11528/m.25764 type:complete len:393 (+) Transcript_11528:180-1358(+)